MFQGLVIGLIGTISGAALGTLVIAATIHYFGRHSRLAAALLSPYLLWVGFASALTWAVWRANPNVL